MIMIGVIYPGHLVCWVSTGFWCPDVLKIYVILFSLKVEVLLVVFVTFWRSVTMIAVILNVADFIKERSILSLMILFLFGP